MKIVTITTALILLHIASAAGQFGTGAVPQTLPPSVVSGYARSLHGELITYHSVVDRARSALLVRAVDGIGFIEWETAPAPRQGKPATFAWLAALSGSKGAHRFEMYIDGKKQFTFYSSGDSVTKSWTVRGKDGGTLSFQATEADRFQDLFGSMFLSLPVGGTAPGKRLTIRVQGEAAQSPAWYMTFEHELADAARARPLPALMRTTRGLMQPVSITVEHYGRRAAAVVELEGVPAETVSLRWGETTCEIPLPEVASTTTRRVKVSIGPHVLYDSVVSLRPVQRRTLYLLPHSHTDIGYSAPQPDVEKSHMRYLDQAITIAETTSSLPEGARFRWNVEVMWPLESYLASASGQQKDRLVSAVQKGWIGLNGLYSNILTGLCRPEELFHVTDFARRASALCGVAVTSAMITDIPSYSSSIVTALGRAGIRYFSSGPNYVSTLPDRGDRIGMALKAWGDRPFYWVSRSGQDTVLFWMAGRGYSWFHGLNMGELATARPSAIFDYLEELDAQHYPYDMVQVRYTIGGDNGPPDPHLSAAVLRWGEKYVSPRFVIATTRAMFEEFESRYGKGLPVYQGDLTPHWEDGAASTAREVAMNRNTAEHLTQTACLAALLRPGSFPESDFEGAWRNVHLFDEHTWGAWNSISEPDSPSVQAQWAYKRNFAVTAERQALALREKIVPARFDQTILALDVINTSSWPRTDVVILSDTLHLAGLRVRDSWGREVPAQRLASGEVAVLVRDVPPMGTERLMFEAGAPFIPERQVRAEGLVLTDAAIRLAVDPRSGGIRSLVGGPRQSAMVDSMAGGLNQYYYVRGRDPREATTDTLVTVTVQDRGPLVASLRIVSSPPGTVAFSRLVRMAGGLGRVDILDEIDKLKVRGKESVHIGFPFSIPGGVVRIDNGWEAVIPGRNQLPGSNSDYYPVQRWVDISGAHEGVTLFSPDAPLLEVGAMTDETLNRAGTRSWRDGTPGSTVLFSYVMNNYWHTNYKADQEGRSLFRYSIIPHAEFDPVAAAREGIESGQPLIVVSAPAGAKPGQSLFTLRCRSTIVQLCRPASEKGGWMLHLFNPGDSPDSIEVIWNARTPVSWFVSDLSGRRGPGVRFPLGVPPHGIAILRGEEPR